MVATTLGALLALVLPLAPAREPQERDSAPVDPFPDSPLGDLGRALLDAINTEERAGREAFVRACVSRAGLEELGVEARVELLASLGTQSGGLEARRTAGSDPLEIYVTARKGGRWARIYAFVDAREPERLREYGVVPIRDPALDETLSWPRARLDEAGVVRAIEEHVAGAAARDEFSGVVLVVRGERVLYQQAVGLADKAWNAPNTLETRFNLASMNKMFTAVAILQLVQEGELRLATPLAEVLPAYPSPEAAARITIEHLLTHTAGLGMLFDRPGFDRRKRYRRHADYLPLFATAPLLYEPGTDSGYSNEGYVVLGAVLEELTGKSYFDVVEERVFAPAGMTATDSFALDDVVPNLATGYAHFEDDPLRLGPWRPNWIFLQWKGSAAGGGYSTAPDLVRFVQALRAGKLLDAELTAAALAPQGRGGWYGYGFLTRQVNGKELRGHGGGGPGSGINAELGWFADGSYAVVVLANYDTPAATELFEGLVGFLALQ